MTEDQHHLDIVLSVKRPHLDHVQDILSLYRSALIYSGGQYKIISDRADSPVRMVFHSGNMLPGRTTIKIGGEPNKPNQVNVQFPNAALRYISDVKYVQDSASIFAAGEPIVTRDLNLIGITRESEALRQASVFLQRFELVKKEVTWATGVEALAVEPGDIAVVGINMTNYEAGYGGRVVDGSSSSFDADRPIDIRSGYSYEMYVWHLATDTVEYRTVASTTGITITVSPTVGFIEQAKPGDRYGIGINSEDLIKVRVLKVTRNNEDGTHELTGEEFVAINYKLDCTTATQATTLNLAPAQPTSATVVVSDCNICFSILTAPNCQGGTFTKTGSTVDGFITASAHNPNSHSLFLDTIGFATGAASGQERTVSYWSGVDSKYIRWSPPLSVPPNSGDAYYINYRQPTFGGVAVEAGVRGAGAGSFSAVDAVIGSPGPASVFSGCVNASNLLPSDNVDIRLIPFSNRGLTNSVGPWVFSLSIPGCTDLENTTNVATITGSSEQVLYYFTMPGSQLGLRNKSFGEVGIFGTEVCSPANETTELALHFDYGGQRLVSSLLVVWNNTTSHTTIGSNLPGTVKFLLEGLGTTSAQFGGLQYIGPSNSGYVDVSKTGVGSVDNTATHTAAILASFNHFDGGVHSHGCFFLTTNRATQGFTDVDSAGDGSFGDIDPPTIVPPGAAAEGAVVAVTSGASFVLINHGLADANAPLAVIPNWNTTHWSTSATANAIYANFGTAAPGSAEVRWIGT